MISASGELKALLVVLHVMVWGQAGLPSVCRVNARGCQPFPVSVMCPCNWLRGTMLLCPAAVVCSGRSCYVIPGGQGYQGVVNMPVHCLGCLCVQWNSSSIPYMW
jgi:hypothetical protein